MIHTIFVIGSGTMGSGIAQVAAQSGYRVIMQDISLEVAQKGLDKIHKGLDKIAAKGKITAEEAAAAKANLTISADIHDAAAADIVIEAATENVEVKKKILAQADGVLKPEGYIASNTSSISITELAGATKRPAKFIGMHFFNPVPVMKLLEITRGYSTSDETVAVAKEIGEKMKKVTVIAVDKAGFIVNRLICPLVNEAAFLVEEGVATPHDIDEAMIYGLNHPMGPLQMADMVGLDVELAVMEVLYREYADPKYRPAPLMKKMVRAGKLGRKSGEGFYKYD